MSKNHWLSQENAKRLLENQGVLKIKNFLENLERNRLTINLIFLMVQTIIILSILLLHNNELFVSLAVFMLIVVFIAQFFSWVVLRFIDQHSKVVRKISVLVLLLTKGISNMDASIVSVDAWYGRVARSKVIRSGLTSSEMETFKSLLTNWHGTLKQLLSASKNL